MPKHDHVVVEDSLGVRATIGEAAVEQHLLKGFTVLGPAVAPGVPVTEDEQAEIDATPAPAPKSGTSAASPKKEK